MARKNTRSSQKSHISAPQDNFSNKVNNSMTDDSSSDESDLDLEALVNQTAQNVKQSQSAPSTSSLFVIDKRGGNSKDSCTSLEQNDGEDEDDESEDNILSDSDNDSSDEDEESAVSERKKKEDSNYGLSSALDSGMKNFSYLSKSAKKHNPNIRDMILKQGKSDDLLKKSAIPAGMEKQENMPGYEESLNQMKKRRREERQQTKGHNWFDMKAPEMTEDKKNDLMVLQMRRSLDPKRFYKAPDIRALPKYFEMGTVVENAADFYSGRIPKKQRKKTLVDELLEDQEFRSYNKRKYQEIQESKMRGRGAYKRMKRLKKNKR